MSNQQQTTGRDEHIKHLEMIQAVITRMNSNSFQIKSYTIALVSALLAVYASTKEQSLLLLGLFPVLMFWSLDGYYLTQERKFRGLYQDAAGLNHDNPQTVELFAMNPQGYRGGQYRYLAAVLSTTLLQLYPPIMLILAWLYRYLPG